MHEPFVPVDRVLVEKLDELFPEKSADLELEIEEVWYRGGQTHVVRFLKQKLKEQELRTMEE
jgi:hypothetical protein